MKSIDIKSLLIGILGTALVMVLMGQSSMQKKYDVECFQDKLVPEYRICKRFNLNAPAWDRVENVVLFQLDYIEKRTERF